MPNYTSPAHNANLAGWTGQVWATEIQSIPENITITSLAIKCHSFASGNVKLALYSDSSGLPDTLLCETPSTAITTGLNTISITGTFTTSYTGKYHVGMQFDDASINLYYTTGYSNYRSNQSQSYGNFPTTYSGIEANNPIYAEVNADTIAATSDEGILPIEHILYLQTVVPK